MLVRPRATLAYLHDAGGLSWLWPAGLALVMVVASAVAVAPISRAAALAEVEAMREGLGGDLTTQEQAQMDQVLQLASNPLFTVVVPALMGSLGLVIGWLFRGGVLFLLGLLLGGHGRFGDMYRMAVWTTLPDVVRTIVTTVGTLASGRLLQAGLAFLVPAPAAGTIPDLGAALWRAFLSGIDLYWLWGLALTTLGVAVTAGLSLRKGLLVTLLYWGLTVLLTLGWLWLSLSLAAGAGLPTG
jgi:hypothetical protein